MALCYGEMFELSCPGHDAKCIHGIAHLLDLSKYDFEYQIGENVFSDYEDKLGLSQAVSHSS
jgi:hypothetical protein